MSGTDLRLNPDYVELIIAALRKWRKKSGSRVFFKFLKERHISWGVFKRMMEVYPQLRHEFELTCAHMADKWYEFGFAHAKLPAHIEKVFLRYLKAYDSHLWDMDADRSRGEETAKALAIAEYVREDYSKAGLEDPFGDIYNDAVERSQWGRFKASDLGEEGEGSGA